MNTQPIQQGIQSTSNNIQQGFDSIKTSFNNSVDSFSQQAQENVGATSSFLASNTIIAKFAFLVLVLIVFVILLNLGIIFMSKLNTPSSNPYLVNGMVDGGNSRIITQDPSNRSSIPIRRSNNESKGLEFTYSVWLYIEEIGTASNSTTQYRNIFNKGDNSYDGTSGIAMNNGPGLYLESLNTSTSPQDAKLLFAMDTHEGRTDIIINNIPIKKWVCVTVRMQNTILDIYVNGIITERKILQETPKQNYYNLHVLQNGGISGKVSNLRYFERALNIFEIKEILKQGPNLKSDNEGSSSGYFTYLSNMWYANKL